MRILRISYEWPPPWIGLTPQPYEITSWQAKKGHVIDVFSGRWPFSGPIEKIEGVRSHTFLREPLPATLVLFIAPIVFLYYMLWRLGSRPDIIHMHGQMGVWILAWRNLARKFRKKPKNNIPIVVHFHNIAKARWEKLKESGQGINWYSEKIAYPLEVFANKKAIKAADAYIFVSEENKNDAIKYYNANPDKCYVIESGVNPELFRPVDPQEREKTRKDIGLLTVDKVIINYGFMVKRKNIDLLVEAMAYLPDDYKLILMGEGDKDYMADLTLRMEDLKVLDRIKRIAATAYPEVPIALQISDVMVLPSQWEGFPKVVLESLACGVPVLSSKTFSVSHPIRGLNFMESMDPQQIAQQIMQIYDSRQPVDRAEVIARYSWQHKVNQIEEVYNAVLSTNGDESKQAVRQRLEQEVDIHKSAEQQEVPAQDQQQQDQHEASEYPNLEETSQIHEQN